jgi:hypothetical protein
VDSLIIAAQLLEGWKTDANPVDGPDVYWFAGIVEKTTTWLNESMTAVKTVEPWNNSPIRPKVFADKFTEFDHDFRDMKIRFGVLLTQEDEQAVLQKVHEDKEKISRKGQDAGGEADL